VTFLRSTVDPLDGEHDKSITCGQRILTKGRIATDQSALLQPAARSTVVAVIVFLLRKLQH